MDFLRQLAAAFFGSIVNGFNDYITAGRRDAALKKLGYSEGDRENLKADQRAMKEARKIYASPNPENIVDTINRL